MSYVALYRKFRPQTFDEVKGQDGAVIPLRNQVRQKRLQHAYLFCGTRGTGKTSVAKILARAVNCEHPVDGNPCNECESCRSILEGRSVNVVEVDAASNNGVDNVREIVDEVRYRPTQGEYKVYIIDEVHMLSAGAFNALLKTLEEPPSYVIFILATTEPEKIPITVHSRCQRYDFRRIGTQTIAARMEELLGKEGLRAEPEAVRFIARKADGSMRDALSLLDRCTAFSGTGTLTYEETLSILGAAKSDIYSELLDALKAHDAKEAIAVTERALAGGGEITRFFSDFLWYMRNVLMVSYAEGDAAELVEASAAERERLKKHAEEIPASALLRMIRQVSETVNDMRYAANKRVAAESCLVRICEPRMGRGGGDALAERVAVLEDMLAKVEADIKSGRLAVNHLPNEAEGAAAPESEGEAPQEEPAELLPALPEEVQAFVESWPAAKEELIASLKAAPENGPVYPLLLRVRPQYDPGKEELVFNYGSAFVSPEGAVERTEKLLADYLAAKYGKEFKFRIIGTDDSGLVELTVDDVINDPERVSPEAVFEEEGDGDEDPW